MKHKHCEEIKAWADGATIQYDDDVFGWVDANTPGWCDLVEYHIKPKPIVIKYRIALHENCGGYYVQLWADKRDDDIEEISTFVRWVSDEQSVDVSDQSPSLASGSHGS